MKDLKYENGERPLISVVSPVYKSERIVHNLVSRIVNSVESITQKYEIILVCDGSPDNSWEMIEKECESNYKVVGLNLSKNFGQHYALTAGLNYSKGQWVVVMDCDLQDVPEEISLLFTKAQEGFDIVRGQRVNRNDSFIKKLSSILFNRIFNLISGSDLDASVGNFAIYSRRVIDEFNKMQEQARDVTVLISTCGFRSISIPVKHDGRAEGKSSYSFNKLMKLATDVIFSNSNKPLTISIFLGFILSTVAVLLAIYNVLAHFAGVITVEGYTTTVFSIWFIGGLLLAQMGILGVYLGKVFNQTKGRQLYIIKDIIDRTGR